MKLKAVLVVLLLAAFSVSCDQEIPTTPDDSVAAAADGPLFGRGKPTCEVDPTHPSCKDGDGDGTAQVRLCAKQEVVEAINEIAELNDNSTQGNVGSTEPDCGVTDAPYQPSGTFAYISAGPQLDWQFNGVGFVPRESPTWYHEYVLIYYPDPWPGLDLVCLGSGKPDPKGRLRLRGSTELDDDLTDAKIWIVRKDWVDCTGNDVKDPDWHPDNVVRLTNDRNEDGVGDATETLMWGCDPPYPCEYGDGPLAYDWLFEEELITYDDTDI